MRQLFPTPPRVQRYGQLKYPRAENTSKYLLSLSPLSLSLSLLLTSTKHDNVIVSSTRTGSAAASWPSREGQASNLCDVLAAIVALSRSQTLTDTLSIRALVLAGWLAGWLARRRCSSLHFTTTRATGAASLLFVSLTAPS